MKRIIALRNEKGFTLVGLLVVVVVVAAVGYGAYKFVEHVVAPATVAAGNAAVAALNAKHDAATIAHNPSPPTPTADQNHFIWRYSCSGQDAKIRSVKVGPIDSDIVISDIQANQSGWTGSRSGAWVVWQGPDADSLDLQFKTTRDTEETTGSLQGKIYVEVVPARAGERTKTVITTIPKKPN